MALKRTFRGRTVQRRESLWLFLATTDVGVAAGVSTLILSLNAAALALRPFTIIRTRGTMFVHSDQAAASEIYGNALGAAVVSDQAQAIGVTAVPTPVTDRGSDLFFLYEQVYGKFEFGTAVGFDGDSGQLLHYDSKAMRKVDGDQDVIFSTETEINGCRVVHSGRMLIKLH